MTATAQRALHIPPARLAGLLYLIIIAGAAFQFYIRTTLIVVDDPGATATNIEASESFYRLGGTIELVLLVCNIVVAVIFYELLKPVNRSLALLAAFAIVVRTAMDAVNLLNWFAPLLLLGNEKYFGGRDYLASFGHDAVHAIALTFTRLHGAGFDIALLFFGIQCVAVGYLFFRSTFFPIVLGAGLMFSGLSYLFIIFASWISPAFSSVLVPNFLIPAFITLLAAKLWLFIMGVNGPNWRKKADASETLAV